MTVHGDMVAYLMCRHGLSPTKAKELVVDILNCIDTGDFAYAFARFAKYDSNESNWEEKMTQYFDVLSFLRETSGE